MNEQVRKFSGPLVIAVTLVLLATWSWGKWADALIDFGRELYVPWRLSQGQRLYSEIAYFNGPLSPMVNGLLFWAFGPSLRLLVFLNLLILTAIVAMTHGLLQYMYGRFVAAVGCVAFLVFMGLAQFMPGGNYNYLAPYSHEMTHGLALSLATLTSFSRYVRGRGHKWLFAAGISAGLTFLTKAEFTIALLPALSVGLLLYHKAIGIRGWHATRVASIFILECTLPVIIAFLLLMTYLPTGEALRGIAGSWFYVFDGQLRSLRFYRDVQGTLDAVTSLESIGVWLGRYAIVFVPAALLSWFVRRDGRSRPTVLASVGLCAAGVTLLGRQQRDWESLARPFPLFLLAVIAALTMFLVRDMINPKERKRIILGLSFTCFSLLLLLKIILNVSLVHYGFVLAMPAAMTVVALLVGFVPTWLNYHRRYGELFRIAAIGALVGFGVVQVSAAHHWLVERTVVFGWGTDRYLIHQRDRAFADLLGRLERLRSPNESLVVVPEGATFNYLARAVNPTGYMNFMPPEMFMFSEKKIVDAFRRHPPDWVVLINRPATEYGYRFFGDDYAQEVFAWIEAHYKVVDRVTEIDVIGLTQPIAAILRYSRQ